MSNLRKAIFKDTFSKTSGIMPDSKELFIFKTIMDAVEKRLSTTQLDNIPTSTYNESHE